MAKKSTVVVVDETTATALTAEILTPEIGDQGAVVVCTEAPAPVPAEVDRDLSTDFLDDAGDASADDPLPGPAPTPEPLGADVLPASVNRWRKRPVVIEAIQYTGNNLADVIAFTGKHPKWDDWFASWEDYEAHVRNDRWAFKVLTTEGTMEALPGDWIIRGTAGEHYPCKPEIFAEIYEDASNPGTPMGLGHDDMVEAYMAGAVGVHEEWLRAHAAGEAPPRGDPEFREAATDHADGYARRYIAHAREHGVDIPPTPDAPPPADPAPVEEPPLSEALLRAQIAVIEERNSDLSRAGLIEELKAIEGASIWNEDLGVTVVNLHGIEVGAAGGPANALRVWCQKARRAIMSGRAV